jgi:hypothetical protein
MSKSTVLMLALVCAPAIAAADSTATLPDETIQVQGHYVQPVQATPISDPTIVPAYSDAAELGNTWSKAWLLLDVDSTGSVRRLKFLKHPGHDLDTIAVQTALRLKFNPARDSSGTAINASVVYPIEWPAHSWLVEHTSFSNRFKPETAKYLKCEGSGPWNLGHVGSPTLKDCSTPDLSKAASEPWIIASR